MSRVESSRVESKSTFLPSPFLVNRVAPISVSLAFGPHRCASKVNATVGGWPSGSTVHFISLPCSFPKRWILSREISFKIFQVFGMTRPGIEPRPTAYKVSILPMGHGHGCAMTITWNAPLQFTLTDHEINADLVMLTKCVFLGYSVKA